MLKKIQDVATLLNSDFPIAENILKGADIGTWIWNVQTGEMLLNDVWARIIGYHLAELEPISIHTLQQFTHPDDLAMANQALTRYFDGETKQYRCEVRMKHKDGHWVKVLDTGQLLMRDEDGQAKWMFGVHVDITEQWQQDLENKMLRERMQLLTENLPGFVYQYQIDTLGQASFPYASANVTDVYGCSVEEIQSDVSVVMNVIHPDDLISVEHNIAQSLLTLEVWHDLFRVNHPTKGQIWVEGASKPKRMPDGSTMWNGYLHDVTEKISHEEQLRLLSKVYEVTQQGVIITDAHAHIVDVNPAFLSMSGFSRNAVSGKHASMVLSERYNSAFYLQLLQAVADDGHWHGEIWHKRQSGDDCPGLLAIDAVKNPEGIISNYVAVFSDISAILQREATLNQIVNCDVLTGLSNRRLLFEKLSTSLEQATKHHTKLAVCYFDLDNFKALNDKFGHVTGDQFLIDVAKLLRADIRTEDVLARVGGDEFIAVLQAIEQGQDMEPRFRELELRLTQLAKNFALDPPVSVSIGTAIFPDDGSTANDLIDTADKRMYEVKRGKKSV